MDDRGERDHRPGHPREARAPHPAADHAGVGLDVTRCRAQAAHAPGGGDDYVEDLGARPHLERAHGLRALAHERSRAKRIDHADAREVETGQDDLGVQVRDEPGYGRRAQQLVFEPPGLGGRCPAPELLAALLGAGDLDPAALGEDAERFVLRRAVGGEVGHHLRVINREDEVRRVTGRAARVRHRALVDEHQLAPSEAGEVIGERVADDPGADDDGAGPAGGLTHPVILAASDSPCHHRTATSVAVASALSAVARCAERESGPSSAP